MVHVVMADYRNPAHARALVDLLDAYARDPAGGGTPLAASTLAGLPAALVVVLASHRGRRIAQQMLARAESEARRRDACKLTLEVLSENRSARRAYEREGFADYRLDPAFGTAIFLQKKL